MNNEWIEKPTVANYWDTEADYVCFIDENGDGSIEQANKFINGQVDINRSYLFLNLIGVMISKNNYTKIKESFDNLKNRYWKNGTYTYKGKEQRVLFHSREIRKKIEAFSENTIDVDSFLNELTHEMKVLDYTLFDCLIDKTELLKNYSEYAHPYLIGIEFLLERFVTFAESNNAKIMLVLESRGKKEDKELLETIKLVLLKGTRYISPKRFNRITSVYFNPKRPVDNPKQTYFGLEIADLCAYPLFKYLVYNNKDICFDAIESKIYKFPNYDGSGIKIFPKEKSQ